MITSNTVDMYQAALYRLFHIFRAPVSAGKLQGQGLELHHYKCHTATTASWVLCFLYNIEPSAICPAKGRKVRAGGWFLCLMHKTQVQCPA